ncbi:putative copine [Lupinus albus]|uniref:Putative copine n=1 Tax=Lupinus albus TaxID=3870 RepID=A0A6A4N4J8_LUPAL|nr:putative copine [Lupinus albus]
MYKIKFFQHNMWFNFHHYTVTTHDQEVFSFHSDHSPCHGLEEVLACYQKIVPYLKLSGPTSYAPVIEAAIDIVDKNHGQFHALVIIAKGHLYYKFIIDHAYPLAIVLVGVGDGPWEDMKMFDDKIPARDFDNFQFVNFTAIISQNISLSQKEIAFALAALMEIPFQYKATLEFGMLPYILILINNVLKWVGCRLMQLCCGTMKLYHYNWKSHCNYGVLLRSNHVMQFAI